MSFMPEKSGITADQFRFAFRSHPAGVASSRRIPAMDRLR